MKLGDKLADIETAEQLVRAKAEAEALAKAAEMEKADRLQSEREFTSWPQDVTADINSGRKPRSFFVKRWVDGREHIIISDPRHRDYDLFVGLERWAEEQGMKLIVDGKPMTGGPTEISLSSK
ncbi:hypothetical protein [Acidisoma sp. 7E03]